MRRRRLIYRAWHRGTRELDLLLGPFAAAGIEKLAGADLERLERLIGEEDTILADWLLGREPPPPDYRPLIDRLIAFRQAAQAQQ